MSVLSNILSSAESVVDTTLALPDPITFATSEGRYGLGRRLYPRQATLIKVIFGRDDLFTEYDYEVLGDWCGGFELPDESELDPAKPLRYRGNRGMTPDVLSRIQWLHDNDAKWFREVVAVVGRRGSKGYLGAIAGAYVLAHFTAKSDPQGYYGIDRDKRMAAFVFAGKREQAKLNQWLDLVNVVSGSEHFEVSRLLGESLTIMSKRDLARQRERESRGIKSEIDPATFIIQPKESTAMAGRGPASFMLFFDEMAHSIATGATRSAGEVYVAAKPSLDQFGRDAFIYSASSPWEMVGQFYNSYLNSCEVWNPHDPEVRTGRQIAGTPVYPDMMMFQLASWDPYQDWERAHTIPLFPPSPEARGRGQSIVVPTFPQFRNAVQTYDEAMQREERSNPEMFAVERRAQWAASMDAYLNAQMIAAMFDSDPPLTMQSKGILNRYYVCHGDPSLSGNNFGWAIAHTEGPDDRGLYSVVFDLIHYWKPQDFPDGQIDYYAIQQEIQQYIAAFSPGMVTFDQYNSAQLIQGLRAWVLGKDLPRHCVIDVRNATASVNWAMAETYKTALNMGLIKAPYLEQAELELRFLQRTGKKVEAPKMGPVQTDDVADAMMNVVWSLIGEQMVQFTAQALADLPMGALPSTPRDGSIGQVRETEIFAALGGMNNRGGGAAKGAFGSPETGGRFR